MDINEFTNNENYKRHIILSLTHSNEEKNFQLALNLGKQYEFPEWEV